MKKIIIALALVLIAGSGWADSSPPRVPWPPTDKITIPMYLQGDTTFEESDGTDFMYIDVTTEPYVKFTKSGAEATMVACDQMSGILAGSTRCGDVWSQVTYTGTSWSDTSQLARLWDTKVDMTAAVTGTVQGDRMYVFIPTTNSTSNPNLSLLGRDMVINHLGNSDIATMKGYGVEMELSEMGASASAASATAYSSSYTIDADTDITGDIVGYSAGFGSVAPGNAGDLIGFKCGGFPTNDANYDDNFCLRSGDTDAFSYHAGFFGIGADDTPNSLFHVQTATSGQSAPNASADEAIFENSANSGISIFSGNTSTGRIAFGDDSSATAGQVVYDHGSSPPEMLFRVEGTARMQIQSTDGSMILTGDVNNCKITIDDDNICDAGTSIGSDSSIAICAVCAAN